MSAAMAARERNVETLTVGRTGDLLPPGYRRMTEPEARAWLDGTDLSIPIDYLSGYGYVVTHG